MRRLFGMGEIFAIEEYTSRADWLHARTSAITATDALPLADESIAYESRWSVWARKSGIVPEAESVPSRFMDWGNRLEPVVFDWYCETTGSKAERKPWRIARRKDKPHLTCSPDGLDFAQRLAVECKNVGHYKADEWEGGASPLKYVVQAQHQMMVLGWDRCDLAVLIGGNQPEIRPQARDEAFIACLEAACDDLWRRVLENDPPPRTGGPGEDDILSRLFPSATPGLRINLPPESAEYHADLERAKGLEKLAEEMHARAKALLKGLMGDAEIGVLPNGLGAYTLRTETKKEHTVRAWTGRALRHTENVPAGKK